MYPPRFRYEAPRTIDDAVRLLAEGAGDAKVLAGGQSLIPLLKLRFASPALLVDINEIGGLDYLDFGADGSVRVGALCRHADLERSEELKVKQPTMAAAAALVADPIVRTRGTLVGSLCHADPQGDWAAVMIALGASLVVQGPGGRRSIPVSELVHGPFQNALAHHEIGVEAVVPAPVGTPMGGYLKLERRIGDFATVGVAVSVDMKADSVARAGIGLVAVGPKTIDAAEAAGSLVGGSLTPERIAGAADLAAAAARPRADHRGGVEYKKHIVRTFVTRILNRVAAGLERAA